MSLQELLDHYDNWNHTIVVNNKNMRTIASEKISDFVYGNVGLTQVKVISFCCYDGELCVRIDY